MADDISDTLYGLQLICFNFYDINVNREVEISYVCEKAVCVSWKISMRHTAMPGVLDIPCTSTPNYALTCAELEHLRIDLYIEHSKLRAFNFKKYCDFEIDLF